jgi:hypothetical protein
MNISLLVFDLIPSFFYNIAILINSWGQQGAAANLFQAKSTSFKTVMFQNNSAEQVSPRKFCCIRCITDSQLLHVTRFV